MTKQVAIITARATGSAWAPAGALTNSAYVYHFGIEGPWRRRSRRALSSVAEVTRSARWASEAIGRRIPGDLRTEGETSRDRWRPLAAPETSPQGGRPSRN